MSAFLLVHGSWHGAWCWDRVVPLLEARGHEVLAIDLPAHGADRGSAYCTSLGAYSRRIQSGAQRLSTKPIVVGHSMGGFAISQAAADAPDRFAALVYLCAFVPVPGESVAALARRDPDTLLASGARLKLSGAHVDPTRIRSIFYGDCSDEAVAFASERLRPDPYLPLVRSFKERHPIRLPRGYIECTRDRAVSIGHQRAMHGRFAFDRVVTMDSDHSPFLSAPEALCRHLDAMASLADPR